MTAEATLISKVRQALAEYDASTAPTQPAACNLVIFADSRLSNVDWNALLGRTDILNLAVAGTMASDWKANWRNNVDQVIASGAKKVIIEYGKNDVDAGKSAAVIAHDIQDIVALIQNYSDARVGVLGPLPVTANYPGAATINNAINQLQNAIPAAIAAISPNGIWYQGFQSLVSGGVLVPAYATPDGAHINTAGQPIYAPSITTLESMIP